MKAIVYERSGGSDVLSLTERPVPEPGPGEVRVRVAFSGVNPTDWKSRTNAQPATGVRQVPNQDGSGVVDAVGSGVDGARVGEPLLCEHGFVRPDGVVKCGVIHR